MPGVFASESKLARICGDCRLQIPLVEYTRSENTRALRWTSPYDVTTARCWPLGEKRIGVRPFHPIGATERAAIESATVTGRWAKANEGISSCMEIASRVAIR